MASDVITRMAGAFARERQFLLHGNSRTTVGVWIATEPAYVLPITADDVELGNAVTAALSSSRTGVPHPLQHEWKGVFKPFLALRGVRSWRAFAVGSTSVNIEEKQGMVVVTATRNRGSREGFAFDLSRQNTIALDSIVELGRATRQLLASAPPVA